MLIYNICWFFVVCLFVVLFCLFFLNYHTFVCFFSSQCESPVKCSGPPDVTMTSPQVRSPLKRSLPPVSNPCPRHVTDDELQVLENCLHRWRKEVQSDVRGTVERKGKVKVLFNDALNTFYLLFIIDTHMHTHTQMRPHTRMHTYTYTSTHTHTYTHTHIHTHTYTHIHTHTHTHIHTHTHTHIYTYTHTHTHIYTHTYTHIHTHIYTHNIYTHNMSSTLSYFQIVIPC